MNANSALQPSVPLAPRPAAPLQTMPVPARWRAVQGILALLTLLGAALYFNLWRTLPPTAKVASDFLGFGVLLGMIFLATPTVYTIAKASFLEAIRRRWVIGFVAFSLLVLAFSSSLTFVQLGEEQRFLQDFGTGFIIAMTILIAIFLGVTLVPPDVERRTIFTVLSKPVNRLEYILGKFFGLCATLFFCLFTLAAFFLVVFAVFNLRENPNAWTTGTASTPEATLGFSLAQLAKAFVLHYGQLVILAALSLMLSLIVTPITAITFCFLAYFGGQTSSYLSTLGSTGGEETARSLSGPMKVVANMVYYLLPRLDHFDVRQQLVTDTAVNVPMMWKAWGSGLIYVAALLTIGYLVFSDREF